LRIVVLTENPELESTPWWAELVTSPAVVAVLVCRKLRARGWRQVLRSIGRNVKKHGPIFIPYRVGVMFWSRLRRRPHRPTVVVPGHLEVRVLEAVDIHAPEVLERVRAFGPHLGVSIGAPILRRTLFGIPSLGTINLHCAKLPDFRGAPPGFWELWTRVGEIGATIHWMDEGLDTGPIVCQATAPIYPRDTLTRVEARATELGVLMLRRALSAIATGNAPRVPQGPGGRTFRQPTLTQRARLALRLRLRALKRLRDPRFLVRTALTLPWLLLVRPVRDFIRTFRGRHPVRVFTFHRVTDLCRDGMTVPASVLRRQIAYVKRHHEVVPLERAVALAASGARLARPVAALSFDDGYRSVFERARPLLAEAGVSGCCFVSTDLLGTDRRFAHDENSPVREHLDLMSWEEVGRLRGEGWSVGGHSATHPRLSECSSERLREELSRPLTALRERLGLDGVPMAYPFGGPDDITDEAVRLVRELGYRACFSDFGGENFPGSDPFELRRIELGGDHDALAWRGRVHGLDFGAWTSRGLLERPREAGGAG
jgi:peptidoglycan/xylan/chitin deacetylase (PgdA/CDA1 family)